jgi:hypothetical protein
MSCLIVSPCALAVVVIALIVVPRRRMFSVVGLSETGIFVGGRDGAVSAAMANASTAVGRVRGLRFFITLIHIALRDYGVMWRRSSGFALTWNPSKLPQFLDQIGNLGHCRTL